MIKILTKTLGVECFVAPTVVPDERSVGRNGRIEPSGKVGCPNLLRKAPPPSIPAPPPKTEIDRAATLHIFRAKKLWDIFSRPEYACEDDGLDALLAEATLY